jgi:hypothetical protein
MMSSDAIMRPSKCTAVSCLNRQTPEGRRRSIAENARAALLGAQDRKRARQTAKSQQPKAKRELQESLMAEMKADVVAAFDAFWRAARRNTRRPPPV